MVDTLISRPLTLISMIPGLEIQLGKKQTTHMDYMTDTDKRNTFGKFGKPDKSNKTTSL